MLGKIGKTLVCAKVNPDLDGTACTLAYSYLLNEMGNNSDGLIFGEPQSEVNYFSEIHKIQIPLYSKRIKNDWDSFVLVDASSIKGVPELVKADKVMEIIDHRVSKPEKEFPNAKIQNELIGAASTIVVERFIKENIIPTSDQAKLLYGAIFHNTLNLISSNTNGRDKSAILYLENEFGLKRRLIEEMFTYSTKEIEKDPVSALEKDAKEFGEGNKISAFQLIVWGTKFLIVRRKWRQVLNN